MWRRTYLFLILIRLWFALSPSYLHPDENFQGPEVIAGTKLFSLKASPPLLSFAPRPATLLPVVDGALLAGLNVSLEQDASLPRLFPRA